MPMNFGFLMDVAILVLLAGTVFFAFRLNLNLKHFKDSRSQMEGLVNRLAVNIERAEKAIAGLQVSARNSGADLDKKIKESKFLSDELKFMSEAGNNLATRLEKLADRNRELIEKIEAGGGLGIAPSSVGAPIVVRDVPREAKASNPLRDLEEEPLGFMIQDREFEEDDVFDELDALDAELEGATSGLQSQAEREFFEAFHKRKTVGGRN